MSTAMDTSVDPARNATGGGVFGQLFEFRRDPVNVLMRSFREQGDIVRFKLGPRTAFLFSHPDGIKHVFVENARNYPRSEFYDVMRIAMGENMITAEGDVWRRRRRIAQPAFNHGKLAALANVMAGLINETVARWRDRPARVIDANMEMTQLTLRIAARTLFGADVESDEGAEIGRALTFSSHFVTRRFSRLVPLPLALPTPDHVRLQRARDLLDRAMTERIEERRRSNEEGNDLLSLLLGARDAETGEALADDELKSEAVGLFGAGHETSASALAWTFYFLSKHPDVRRRLQAETSRVLDGRPVSAEHLGKLEYTRAVIQESMRLRPPVWGMSRTAIEEDHFQGHAIPRRSFAFVSPYVTHRHPRYWPNPEGFDPERFMPGNEAARAPLAYFPFGAGGHKCIGQGFAMMEMQLVVAAMSDSFELDLMPGVEVEMDPAITLRPKGEVPMMLRSKRSADGGEV
jgi:cytochrome P450